MQIIWHDDILQLLVTYMERPFSTSNDKKYMVLFGKVCKKRTKKKAYVVKKAGLALFSRYFFIEQ